MLSRGPRLAATETYDIQRVDEVDREKGDADLGL
jgi:hypothetical protein